ncbi:MAG: hypothetical protein OHK0032_19080 [Thermodesulfovibrionales bacterium]
MIKLMKKLKKARRIAPRIPASLALRLGSHPITTKKGDRGYSREKDKEIRRLLTEVLWSYSSQMMMVFIPQG